MREEVDAMILYHGSNTEVQFPKILTNGYYKDFGYGFYCTEIKKQAQRWALTKRGRHIVNMYEYTSDKSLNTISFKEMSDEWLNFIVDCRRGIEHKYDIVEGAMADDTIWNYIESYVKGEISKDAFWELARFRYPTHQIVFCTEQALSKLKWLSSEEVSTDK